MFRRLLGEPAPDQALGCAPITCAGLAGLGALSFFGGAWPITVICVGLILLIGFGEG